MGLGNREPDATFVRFGNYIGTVVKAYAPTERRVLPVQLAETGNERLAFTPEKGRVASAGRE